MPHNQSDNIPQQPQHGGNSARTKRRARIYHCISQIFSADSWSWEVFAIHCSVAFFCDIIYILLRRDDQPHVDSLPLGLTLNATVSVLATGSKALLITAIAGCIGQMKWIWFSKGKRSLEDFQYLENASRGPLGSIIVLVKHRPKSYICIGAAVYVLAVAFDPFMQQVLRYPTVYKTFNLSTNRATGLPTNIFNEDFVRAIYAGVWANMTQKLPSCPSLNCSWSPFESVGFCTKCDDVTDTAKLIGCDKIDIDTLKPFVTNFQCSLALSEGRPLLLGVSLHESKTTDKKTSYHLEIQDQYIWGVSVNELDGKSYVGLKDPYLVMAHAKLSTPERLTNMQRPLEAINVLNVTQCILSPCSWTYKIKFENGTGSRDEEFKGYGVRYNETYQSHEGGKSTAATRRCWKAKEGPSCRQLNEHSIKNDAGRFSTFTNVVNATPVTLCEPTTSFRSLAGSIEYALTGHKNVSWTYSPEGWSLEKQREGKPFYQPVRAGLELVMKNVATELTNLCISTGQNTADGEAIYSNVNVDVAWLWLIFPGALLLLGYAFVILTIQLNARRKLQIWKLSALPMLYHGLEAGVLENQETYDTVSAMEAHAASITVDLQRSENIPRLTLRD
ncbi:hypothetical protein BDV25DRAFT_136958 [Aspergillus avenaceus]|uniref:Uncharacterized protein n=1 Tax=Aspergillus avenaceus TaxID=36643 RepID=A0A5N6U466_ASPAV|nr:hypothetical protein BDV25DRAFT_136958 [Aspergillus avenaceus]